MSDDNMPDRITVLAKEFTPAAMEFHRRHMAEKGYRLEGGTASVYVTVNAGIYTGLKWLADDPPHVSLDDLVERLGQLVEQLVSPA